MCSALKNTEIAPFLWPLYGPYTLAKRNAIVRMSNDFANAWQYASAASLLAPYGEIGFGSDCSLTGGVALPIRAPPVEEKIKRSTPACLAALRTLNVPAALA